MGKNIRDCNLLIIGLGSVGTAAALLASEMLPVRRILLYNRTKARAEEVGRSIVGKTTAGIFVCDSLDDALSSADIIISATSSAKELTFDKGRLRPGAIVCDIARPRDFPNIEGMLVYDGGMVACEDAELPGLLGLPEGLSFACLFQTQSLAEAEETEHIGGVGGVYDYDEIKAVAAICNPRSGGVAALRSGDGGIITDEDIERIKQAAARAA